MSNDLTFLDSLLEDIEHIVTNENDLKSLKYVPHPPPDIPSMVILYSFFSYFLYSDLLTCLLLYFVCLDESKD